MSDVRDLQVGETFDLRFFFFFFLGFLDRDGSHKTERKFRSQWRHSTDVLNGLTLSISKPGIGSFGSSIRGDDPESTSLLVVMRSVEL